MGQVIAFPRPRRRVVMTVHPGVCVAGIFCGSRLAPQSEIVAASSPDEVASRARELAKLYDLSVSVVDVDGGAAA